MRKLPPLEDQLMLPNEMTDSVFATVDIAGTAPAYFEVDVLIRSSREVEKGEAPWLTDELLDRVFWLSALANKTCVCWISQRPTHFSV